MNLIAAAEQLLTSEISHISYIRFETPAAKPEPV